MRALGNSNDQIDLMRAFVDVRLRLQLRFRETSLCVKLRRTLYTRTDVSHVDGLIRPNVELFPKSRGWDAQ